MTNLKQTIILAGTNIKRLKNYILSMIISILIILLICSAGAIYISKNLYGEGSQTLVSIAYYLPDDEDQKFNNFGLNIIKDLESTQEIVNLIQVETIDEGYELLEKGDILYYIIVPEMFFSGIMDSTNPSLTILIKDNSSISSYISNELFGAYARYLGTAQAGVYSALDATRAHELDSDTRKAIQKKVNVTFLDRALNKDNYIIKENAADYGDHSLLEGYLATAVMLSLFFVSFIIMPYLQGFSKGITTRLSSRKINSFHIFLCNYFSIIPAFYIAFIPCYLAISIFTKSFNPMGLITVIPGILIIALLVNIISSFSKSTFAGNMLILTFTILITYIGGGILPRAMLPQIIKDISPYLPGEYLISIIANSLFGL
ncbi:MAG: ABC transporter permease [Lachnospiraceae bacterium]|nr:ABC transporter permease [Lachnospiraceae bacterium]